MAAPLGNQNRANQYRIRRTLERLLERRSGTSDALEGLEKACEAMLAKAEEGDVSAFREIADRLDGKPNQTLDATVQGSLAGILSAISSSDDPPLEA